MAEQKHPSKESVCVLGPMYECSDHMLRNLLASPPSLQLADSQLQRAISFFLRLTHLAAKILEPSIERESEV